MFVRTRKLLGNVLGTILYWIGWVLAVIVLAQAIILSVTTGNPLIPVILGVAGVIFWLLAIGFKLVLAKR
jgi:FtsH-binding integral membrane protein